MRPPLLRSAIVALAPLLLLASCNPSTDPPAQGQAHLAVTANVVGTAVATVVVEVTAPDISTPLVFNIVVADGVASGTITIPAGTARRITIRAFDAGGVLTHSGAATVSVQAGTNRLPDAHAARRGRADRGTPGQLHDQRDAHCERAVARRHANRSAHCGDPGCAGARHDRDGQLGHA